jgi:hypothetical protein
MADNSTARNPATDAATKAAEAGAKLGHQATQAAGAFAATGQDAARHRLWPRRG